MKFFTYILFSFVLFFAGTISASLFNSYVPETHSFNLEINNQSKVPAKVKFEKANIRRTETTQTVAPGEKRKFEDVYAPAGTGKDIEITTSATPSYYLIQGSGYPTGLWLWKKYPAPDKGYLKSPASDIITWRHLLTVVATVHPSGAVTLKEK